MVYIDFNGVDHGDRCPIIKFQWEGFDFKNDLSLSLSTCVYILLGAASMSMVLILNFQELYHR